MKVALLSRIGPPLPSAQVCERVAVGPLARKFPLLPARYQAKAPPPTQVVRPPFFVNENTFFAPLVQVTPPTQVVRPPFFVNENKFFAPLVQQVPMKERMLGGNVTGAELKHVLEANAKALRHGGKPTTLGYGTDWATIQERAAERLRVKSEQLKAHEKDRTAEKDRRRRTWNAMDAKIRKVEPDLTKRDRAKKIAAKLGGSWRVIERHIPK
jgi:hypothetical protein